MIYADFLQLFLTRRTQKDAGNKNNSMRERVNHTPTALFFNFRWWQYDRRGCLREDAMYFFVKFCLANGLIGVKY